MTRTETETEFPETPRSSDRVIRPEEYEKYLVKGRDFIDEDRIEGLLDEGRNPDPGRIRAALDKARAIERLEPEETAALLGVRDPALWEEIFEAALDVKLRVYGSRIVTFAPVYFSNRCVNSCLYCGFRRENRRLARRRLEPGEVTREIEALVAEGHKRIIAVFGEHPTTDVDYIAETLRRVYAVRTGRGEIRRANVNAAPMRVADLKRLADVGIGTFQVFQETYHHGTYSRVHPRGIKACYPWRLYAMHRAMEAGIDDVGLGALFGLHDWRFEVMGLLFHTLDLERRFDGVGPHTISFPRLEPAAEAPLARGSGTHAVSDKTFKRLVAVLRLSSTLHRAHRHRPRARRDPPRGDPAGVHPDRRLDPHRRGRLRGSRPRGRSLGRTGPGTSAVPAGRYPRPGRSHRRARGDGLHHVLLHRGIPVRPHGETLHGPGPHRRSAPFLHAQRGVDLQGIPFGFRLRGDARKRRSPHRPDLEDLAGNDAGTGG